jgi:hypothetical protein
MINREREIRETIGVPDRIKDHAIERERQFRELERIEKEAELLPSKGPGYYLFPNVVMTLTGPYVFDPFQQPIDPDKLKVLETTAESFRKWLSLRPVKCPNDPRAYCLPQGILR